MGKFLLIALLLGFSYNLFSQNWDEKGVLYMNINKQESIINLDALKCYNSPIVLIDSILHTGISESDVIPIEKDLKIRILRTGFIQIGNLFVNSETTIDSLNQIDVYLLGERKNKFFKNIRSYIIMVCMYTDDLKLTHLYQLNFYKENLRSILFFSEKSNDGYKSMNRYSSVNKENSQSLIYEIKFIYDHTHLDSIIKNEMFVNMDKHGQIDMVH